MAKDKRNTTKRGRKYAFKLTRSCSYLDKINVDEVLVGGEALKVGSRWRFRVLHTPGHTSGTICLLGGAKDDDSSKMFFSGDHILPSITPNISLSPLYTTSEDPLGDYLSSIRSL